MANNAILHIGTIIEGRRTRRGSLLLDVVDEGWTFAAAVGLE